MNQTQLPFLVEAILILTTMTFGFLLRRTGKPYGVVKLGLHIFFSLWFTTGYGFIVYSLSIAKTSPALWLPVVLMGLMILAQLVSGLLMMVDKTPRSALPKFHLFAAVVLLASDLGAFVLAGRSL